MDQKTEACSRETGTSNQYTCTHMHICAHMHMYMHTHTHTSLPFPGLGSEQSGGPEGDQSHQVPILWMTQ